MAPEPTPFRIVDLTKNPFARSNQQAVKFGDLQRGDVFVLVGAGEEGDEVYINLREPSMVDGNWVLNLTVVAIQRDNSHYIRINYLEDLCSAVAEIHRIISEEVQRAVGEA